MSVHNEHILQTAYALFADRGTSEVNLSEIATAAGVSRGTLYRKFGSTEAIYAALVEQLSRYTIDRIGGVMERAGIHDPVAQLATGVRLIIRISGHDLNLARFIVRFGLSDTVIQQVLTTGPARAIRDGVTSGAFSVPERSIIPAASFAVAAAVSGISLVLAGRRGWDEAGRDAAGLLLRALGVDTDTITRMIAQDLPDESKP